MRRANVSTRGGAHNDVWATPDWLWRPLDELLRFELDAAADKRNAKCRRFYDERANGLVQPWDAASVWINSPYGRKDSPTEAWVRKARATAAELGNRVTALLPVKADTTWWHDAVWGSNRVVTSAVLGEPIAGRWYRLRERWGFVEVLELRGRVNFGGAAGPGWFASAVVVFNAGPVPLLPQLRRYA